MAAPNTTSIISQIWSACLVQSRGPNLPGSRRYKGVHLEFNMADAAKATARPSASARLAPPPELLLGDLSGRAVS